VRGGGRSPAEGVGGGWGVSESAATSLLCVLAGAGKVRISLVEPNDGAADSRFRSSAAAPSAERLVSVPITGSRKRACPSRRHLPAPGTACLRPPYTLCRGR